TRDGLRAQLDRSGQLEEDVAGDRVDVHATRGMLEMQVARGSPVALVAPQALGHDRSARGVDGDVTLRRDADLEGDGLPAAPDRPGRVLLADREPTVGGLEDPALRQASSVDGPDGRPLTLLGDDPDLGGSQADPNASVPADRMVEGQGGVAGGGPQRFLPSARIARAASSALISRRASRSRISSRLAGWLVGVSSSVASAS